MNSQGEYRVSSLCCLPRCCRPLPPGTSSLPLSCQGVTHCAIETAKLGPLAFYKVPSWGCGGWARRLERGRLGRAGRRGEGPEQIWGRSLWGSAAGSLCQAFVRLSLAWPWPAASLGLFWACRLGPGTAAAAALHPLGSQTGMRVWAVLLGHSDLTDQQTLLSSWALRAQAWCSHPYVQSHSWEGP